MASSTLALLLTRLRSMLLSFTRFFDRVTPQKKPTLPSTATAIRAGVADVALQTTGWRSLPSWALGAERLSQAPTRLCERQTDPIMDSAVPASIDARLPSQAKAPTVSWSRLPGWAIANPAGESATSRCTVVQPREVPADESALQPPSFVRPDDCVLLQLDILADPTAEEKMLCEALGEPDRVLVSLGIRAKQAAPAGCASHAGTQTPARLPTQAPVVDATISLLSDETVRLSIRLL